MNDTLLRELGEWAALGFYEGLDLPRPRAYGLAYRRLYEHMDIAIPAGRFLLPAEPLPHAWTWTENGVWTATSLVLDHNHHCGLRVNEAIAADRKQRFPQHAAFIDSLTADLKRRLTHFGGYTHSNPDMRRVVTEGFAAMVVELDGELAALQAEGDRADPEALNLLLALKDYTDGVHTFYQRSCAAIRQAAERATDPVSQRKLTVVADAFASSFQLPASSFVQGLLAVHFTWLLDGCDSIGRLDQVLGPLFEADLAAGRLDIAFARELLDELWGDFERFNGWNMQIGGFRPDGKDGCNALTLECIAACGRNHHRRPNVAFRITRDTPDAAVVAALEVLREGSGRPALYNDDLYVQTLLALDLGLTPEDSREIGFGGCTETMIAGLSNCGSLEGELNLALALELALFDGLDPLTGKREGPHTGRFEEMQTYAQFEAAVRRQIQYLTDGFVARSKDALTRRLHEGDPKLPRTFFTRDCVKRHRSFEAGGARYNWAVVSYQGIANLIDGLAAVRKCVFEDATVSRAELLGALRTDFRDHELLRRRLQAAPKFGNDDPAVDEPGAEIVRFAWEQLLVHETPRGGRYLPSCILFVTYYGAGLKVGATPDGRCAREVLTDSVGPAQGRDRHGPTAMLNSVAWLPLHLAAGTPVLNIRFTKPLLADPISLGNVVHLIRTFFAAGGMQIQVSVLDREALLAAQCEPDKHRDLIVRVGGYSEYFVNLNPELQASVIARTEHG
jgi:formate C-acetyltransferase